MDIVPFCSIDHYTAKDWRITLNFYLLSRSFSFVQLIYYSSSAPPLRLSNFLLSFLLLLNLSLSPLCRLLQIIPENTPLQRAFSVADDVLRQGVVGISEIIIRWLIDHFCPLLDNAIRRLYNSEIINICFKNYRLVNVQAALSHYCDSLNNHRALS